MMSCVGNNIFLVCGGTMTLTSRTTDEREAQLKGIVQDVARA